jgi:3-oxoadipate enol-lactonase
VTARLAHSVAGPLDAPVIVLGSSLGTTRMMWEPQWPELSQQFRLISFDHRGHGGSEVPDPPYQVADLGDDVLAMLDGLGVERFSFAGLSLGGMVGIWLAANAAHRVDRLALLCTSAALGAPDAWLTRAAAVRSDGMGSIADAVVGRWFTPGFPAEHPDVVARHRAMLVATPVEGYARCCEAIAVMDQLEDLARIEAPTLVIGAQQDTAIPPAHSETLAAGIRSSRLEVIDDAAHLASVEQRAAITRLLVDHVGGR